MARAPHRQSFGGTQHASNRVTVRDEVMRWLQLRFDLDSTAVRRPYNWLSNVVQLSYVTRSADPPAAVTLTYLFI